MSCPICLSTDLEFLSGDYHTGVVAPDGYRETRYEEGYQCRKCGAVCSEGELLECQNCRVPLTPADFEAGCCTQCQTKLT